MMSARIVIIYCLVTVVLVTADDDLAYPFCAHVTSTAQALPTFPVQFVAYARVDDLVDKFTDTWVEYFDKWNGYGRIDNSVGGYSAIYDYNADEILTIIARTCVAEKLSTSTGRFYFGYVDGAMRNSTYALKFGGDYSQVFVERTTIRGIIVDHWRGCVTNDALRQSYTTDHFLYAYADALGRVGRPLMIKINGVLSTNYTTGSLAPLKLVYNYFSFIEEGPIGAFTPPQGIFCPRNNQARSPPQIAAQFYAHIEIINKAESLISEIDLWWDSTNKVSRTDVQDSGDINSVIQDYNTGAAYVIDQVQGNCTVTVFDINYEAFAVTNQTTTATRPAYAMRTSMELFNIDSTFRYMGKRPIVGSIIQADVYAGVRTDLPRFEGKSVTVEVYFTQSSVVQTNTENVVTASTPIPVRLDFSDAENGTAFLSIIMSDYAPGPFAKSVFDVTKCFDDRNVKHFQLELSRPPPQSSMDMAGYQTPLLALAHAAMLKAANVSSLRLQALDLMWDGKSIYVKGRLTEKPPSISSFSLTKTDTFRFTEGVRDDSGAYSPERCAFLCLYRLNSCASFTYCKVTDQGTDDGKGSPFMCYHNSASAGTDAKDGMKCDLYTKPFTSPPNLEPVLTMAYENLKNAVYGNKLSITLAMANGQSMSFTGITIRDDILQRDIDKPEYSTSEIMRQFTLKKGLILVSKGEMHSSGLSVDACAGYCNDIQSFRCQGFNYCFKTGDCYLTRTYIFDTSDESKYSPSTTCDLYIRNYMYRFQKSPGRTMIPTSEYFYNGTKTEALCAKLCVQQVLYPITCRSFEYCAQISTCVLETSHLAGTPVSGAALSEPLCHHYTRSFVVDFKISENMQTSLTSGLQVLKEIKLEDCAKTCMDLKTGCIAFDYCAADDRICTILGTGLTSVDQITLVKKPKCSHYTKTTNADGTPFNAMTQQQSQLTSTPTTGYNSGAMVGLGIGMALLTLGVVSCLVYAYKKEYIGSFLRSR